MCCINCWVCVALKDRRDTSGYSASCEYRQNIYACGHEWGLVLNNGLGMTCNYWKIESGVLRGSVFQVSILTRYIATSLGNRFPTFRMNRVPSVGLLDFEEKLHSDTTRYPRRKVVLM